MIILLDEHDGRDSVHFQFAAIGRFDQLSRIAGADRVRSLPDCSDLKRLVDVRPRFDSVAHCLLETCEPAGHRAMNRLILL
jgi:hypothetical protein